MVGVYILRSECRGVGPHGSHFSQTEIQNLRVTSVGDEDIRGLNVSMNDSLGMRGIERVSYIKRDFQRPLQFQRRPEITCFRVFPSRYSMAMKALPFSSPMSWMVQMFGWFSAEAACASL